MGNITILNLNELISKYNLDTFVETGTLYGDGIDYALTYPFKHIHSIEIIPELALKASLKYSSNSRVTIHTGNSADVLPDIVDNIDGNILFWLDAHFPGADAKIRPYAEMKNIPYTENLPLEKEIQSIAKRVDKFKDCLILDDLWIYEDCKDHGLSTFDNHCKNHSHDIKLSDVINDGKDLSFLYDTFSATHEFKKVYRHQGYVVVTPK